MNYYKNVRLDQMKPGERLSYYRKEKKLTQEELGKKTLTSQKLVAAWENDTREIKPCYIDDICKALDITSSELLRGKKAENETVCDSLGLCDEAVEYLKSVSANKDVSFPDLFYGTDVDTVDGEGGSNNLVLKTLNLLLSTNVGDALLQAIGNYCFGNFDKGFPIFEHEVAVPVDPIVGDPVPIDSVKFKIDGIHEGCNISLDLMKFSLLRAIENYINQLRDNVKED